MAERKSFNNFFNKVRGFFDEPVKEIEKPYTPVNNIQKRIKKKSINRRGFKAQTRDLIILGRPKYYKHL